MARLESMRKVTEEQLKEKVGEIYGCYKIIEFLREETTKTKYYSFIYKVQCINCGNIREMSLASLKKGRERMQTKCKKCFRIGICTAPEEAKNWSVEKRTKAVENARKNGRANINNVSTGIKHYYIQLWRGMYIHQILCQVDGIKYKIRTKCTKFIEDAECKVIVEELNEALKEGKEAFYEWFKEAKLENGN